CSTDQLDERLAFVLGQAACHLVEQKHARLARQCAGKLKPLAVEQTETARGPVCLVRQPALLEQCDTSLRGVTAARAAAKCGCNHEILKNRHAMERLRDLEGAANAHSAAPLRGKTRDVVAFKGDPAAIRFNRA